MSREEPTDHGLETLLSMNGEVFVLKQGYWVHLEAWRVAPSLHRPHGVRYCLTLHDAGNRRLLGYDNAHAMSSRKRRFTRKQTEWDHRHEVGRVTAYEFVSAERLLIDFWNDVERLLRKLIG